MDKQVFLDALPIIAFVALLLFKGHIFGLIFRFKNISAKKALEILNEKASDTYLIDVRTTGEFASSHLNGAINMPLGTLKKSLVEHSISKDSQLFLICASGSRSSSAAISLKFSGYKNITNINGGMMMASRLSPAKS